MRQEGSGSALRARVAAVSRQEHEHARTMAIADSALCQIRTLNLPATPRVYEVWYAYSTGEYPTLNLVLDSMLARRVTMNDADIDKIGARFVSPGGLQDKVDDIGADVAKSIKQVMATIDSGIGLAGSHAEDLDEVDAKLFETQDPDALNNVVGRMTDIASRMQDDQRKLEAQFDASKSQIDGLRAEIDKVIAASMTDTLTGVGNRKSLEQMLQKAIKTTAETHEPLCLMMCDVDSFKEFNDSWGHLVGDQVLRLVATTLKNNVRPQDFVARYGGEEFAVMLPNAPIKTAYAVADNIRRMIMTREIVNRATAQDMGRVTISFGVARARSDDTIEMLIARADSCLYAAKCNGRNRVILETDPQFTEISFDAAIVR
jgi:diguanylate cyclase